MKADERKHLEENTLVHGVTTLMERVKSGRLVNFRWLAILLAVVLIIGVWWYAVSQSKRSDSQLWSGLSERVQRGGQSSLDEFAGAHPDTTVARIARMEAARILLGSEGLALLQNGDKAERDKGVENLKKAREEFAKLAEAFEDQTLRATCLLRAAEAELALVGVPRDNGLGSVGDVSAAADLYRKVAQIIGEATPVGEQANKRADELMEKRDEIVRVGTELYDRPLIGSSTPGIPSPAGPKAPEGLLPNQPPDAPKPDGPKAPVQPLSPPPAAGGVIGGVATPAPTPPPIQPMPGPNKK